MFAIATAVVTPTFVVAAVMVIPTFVASPAIVMTPAMVASPTVVVEAAMVEVSGVVSIEKGAIVFEIDPVAIVTTPCGIIIIGVSGIFRFAYSGCGIVSAIINRSGCVFGLLYIDGCGGGCSVGGADINMRNGYADTKMCADENLRITFGGDEAGGYGGGGKDK